MATRAAQELLRRRAARRDYLAFMHAVWWKNDPFLVGRHTRAIAERLTRAVEDYLDGRSTFLLIKVPFRHGKSDLVSRGFTPYFLGRCHEHHPDVILSGYGASLVMGFSRRARHIIDSPHYRAVFPGIEIDPNRRANDKWALSGSTGEVTATGLGGAVTGHGGHLIVLDDYCKSREEAESATYRDKVWHAFTNDLMTRRAPVSIVVVVATPWHVDDVFGRVEAEMNNPEFPRFETLAFPAGDAEGLYDGGPLFPERFTDEWYATQRATLGLYGASGLLDCSPRRRGGNRFLVDRVVVHDSLDEFPPGEDVRSWDLASTEKQIAKSDPDWTCGAKLRVIRRGIVNEIWLSDMVRVQAETTRRDMKMLATAAHDGPGVRILVEAVAGYKDAVAWLKKRLHGVRRVEPVHVSRDKFVRSLVLEPVIEAGNFHILRGPWNEAFLAELGDWPSGAHDDQIDAVVNGYTKLTEGAEVTYHDGALRGIGVF
jgi:predicted phage terminase large subunit-like protein